MRDLVGSLLDNALSEINRREPDYLTRFPVNFPPLAEAAIHYRRPSALDARASVALEEALRSSVAFFEQRGVRQRSSDAANDPIGKMLLDSAIDAFAAGLGDLRLRPADTPPEVGFADLYEQRQTAGGRRYLLARAGERPLVLVNACGMPLSLWSRLLNDRSHGLRILTVESRGATLAEGGMSDFTPLAVDAADIVAAMDDAGLDHADLLAWCNGGRIAIDVAAQLPHRIGSVILVSPTLRGAMDVPPQGGAFEDEVDQTFRVVVEQPNLADAFAQAFGGNARFSARESLTRDPSRRALKLFAKPPEEWGSSLIAPMVRADFLRNYSRRAVSDQAYPVHDALQRLAARLLVITGDHDDRVRNTFTSAVLEKWSPAFTLVQISGAGHYAFDLQYQYFRSVMLDFLRESEPAGSARVAVTTRAPGSGSPAGHEKEQPS